jgi:hypothetical protein
MPETLVILNGNPCVILSGAKNPRFFTAFRMTQGAKNLRFFTAFRMTEKNSE